MSRLERIEVRGAVAVVTGGASGIGRALTLLLLERGARVAVLDAKTEGCDELRERGALTDQVDVRSHEAVREAAEHVAEALGPVDLLFNNAGVAAIGPAFSLPLADTEWVIQVNLLGAINVTQCFVPQMLGRNTRVAFTCSLAGLLGTPTMAAYSASKFGLRGYAQALRSELRGGSTGITLVYPGYVPTGLHAATHYHGTGVRELVEAIPRGLAAPPEQVAEKILRATLRGQRELVLGPERLFLWLQRWSPAGFERAANSLLDLARGQLSSAP